MKRRNQPQPRKGKVYHASLVKRVRRSQADINNLLEWVQSILSYEDDPITIRHLFYRLVGEKVIPKTESAYQQLIAHLSKWRRCEEIRWDAFADSTRFHIKAPTFDSMDAALENTVSTYRRNLWAGQKTYVECWVEKDAVAAIITRAADPFGVPVFVARGFASLSSLYNAANTFREWSNAGKRCVVYHLGDFDPSGVAAGESMIRSFRDDFKVDVDFIRAAVTQEQIERLQLPTRPVKTSDSRAAKWKGGECVELDTMKPADIRALVENCIVQHIDKTKWELSKSIEEMERSDLVLFKKSFGK